MNIYRMQDRDRKSSSKPLTVSEFSDTINKHRPEWFLEFIKRKQLEAAATSEDQKKRLKELANYYRITWPTIKELDGEASGSENTSVKPTRKTESGAGRGEKNAKKTVKPPRKSGQGKSEDEQAVSIPNVIWVEDESKLSELEIESRLALYSQRHVYFNALHPSVGKSIAELVKSYGEEHRSRATQLVKEEIEQIAIEFILFSETQSNTAGWTPHDTESVLSAESLTIASGCVHRICKGCRLRMTVPRQEVTA